MSGARAVVPFCMVLSKLTSAHGSEPTSGEDEQGPWGPLRRLGIEDLGLGVHGCVTSR